MQLQRGLLVVISSPSGGGKTTVIQELRRRCPELKYSISATTRPPRKGEKNGRDYFFLTEAEFRNKIAAGEFIEWAEVHGYLYGTTRQYLEPLLQQGETIVLDIDVVGGLNIKKLYPQDSLLVFLKPPSVKELFTRLWKRGTEATTEIVKRFSRVPWEIAKAKEYDVVIVNKDLTKTVNKIIEVIQNYKKHGGR
ncbi:guanylate kinase [candidate division KSB1 bacterium]|nr:MAG: guanylate kinase [candidate division KSB1 bacterium]